MPNRDDSSTRSWDAVANDWVAHADENDYRNDFLMPLTLELLGEVRGLRILDVGCGEGGYARELARRGANVVGVDGSPELVAVAKRRAAEAGQNIEHICANASSLEPIQPESFDSVLASMVLMDVEDYPSAVDQIWRVLVPGGTLLMSITHPCFSAPTSEWVRTESGEPRYFAVDRYFERIAWADFITARFRRPVLRRHQPLQDFVGPLLERGFLLRDFREPSATREHLRRSERLRRLTRIPYFLFMSWQKPK
jgi:2-polyprenyl-3-methyl-5-hydroxy-6-metoxy-1,4-benzoquinol methylase